MHAPHIIISLLLMGLRCLEQHAPPRPTTGRGNCSSDIKPIQRGRKMKGKDRGQARAAREHGQKKKKHALICRIVSSEKYSEDVSPPCDSANCCGLWRIVTAISIEAAIYAHRAVPAAP